MSPHRHARFVYSPSLHFRVTTTQRRVIGEWRSVSWPQVGHIVRGLVGVSLTRPVRIGSSLPAVPLACGSRRGRRAFKERIYTIGAERRGLAVVGERRGTMRIY